MKGDIMKPRWLLIPALIGWVCIFVGAPLMTTNLLLAGQFLIIAGVCGIIIITEWPCFTNRPGCEGA